MEDDEPEEYEAEETPAPPEKPSKTPSWIMLGFVLGAVFVAALPKRSTEPLPVTVPRPMPTLSAPAPRRLMTIEATFDAWGQYAIWDHDRTEFSLWNEETKGFTDHYEAIRIGERLFFRSIERLTRLPLERDLKPDSPLRFTETQERRTAFLNQVQEENARAMIRATRETFGAPKPEVEPVPVLVAPPVLPQPEKPVADPTKPK